MTPMRGFARLRILEKYFVIVPAPSLPSRDRLTHTPPHWALWFEVGRFIEELFRFCQPFAEQTPALFCHRVGEVASASVPRVIGKEVCVSYVCCDGTRRGRGPILVNTRVELPHAFRFVTSTAESLV